MFVALFLSEHFTSSVPSATQALAEVSLIQQNIEGAIEL